MDAEQARELALNARLNHWPAHLGVNTDAEKIEHLASKLDEVATWMAINETDGDKLYALEEEYRGLDVTNSELKEEIEELKAKIKEIQGEQ